MFASARWANRKSVSRWSPLLLMMLLGMYGTCTAEPSTSSAIVNKVIDTTVYIEVNRILYGRPFTTMGSGFFVSDNGHILTNSHVVSEYIELVSRGTVVNLQVSVLDIRVVMNPRTPQQVVYPAKVIANDPDRDLALIKIAHKSPNYLKLKKGVTVKILDEIFVAGFPLGDSLTLDSTGWASRTGGYPEVSVNYGRVSSLRRDERQRPVAIQTDAAINPGNSGGPMMSAEGELVGVVYSSAVHGEQIGFAIAPSRVWGFLQAQKIVARFTPSFVAPDYRSILLTVTEGSMLEGVSGGSAVLSGPNITSSEYPLKHIDGEWRAALEFVNPTGEFSPSSRYLVKITLWDTQKHTIASHSYALKGRTGPHQDNRPVFTISNRMTLSDWAHKEAAEQAADSGKPLSVGLDSDQEQSSSPPKIDPSLLEDLRAEARTQYKSGNYETAIEIFSQIVEADPSDEVSADYLELAQARLKLTSSREEDYQATEVEAGEPEPVLEPPAVTVLFDSPVKKGSIKLWVDGQPLETITFEFKRKKESRRVERTLSVPAGSHTLQIELAGIKEGSFGMRSAEADFSPGESWTLRLDLSPGGKTFRVYLINPAQGGR